MTSPQLPAAKALLVTKPRRVCWKGWHAVWQLRLSFWKHVDWVPSQICPWLFLRFIAGGESTKQESQPADYVGWTRRSALQPRPHGKCHTAWGRGLLDSGDPAQDQGAGLGVQRGSRESLHSPFHTAGQAGTVTPGGKPSPSVYPALGNRPRTRTSPAPRKLRERGREAMSKLTVMTTKCDKGSSEPQTSVG